MESKPSAAEDQPDDDITVLAAEATPATLLTGRASSFPVAGLDKLLQVEIEPVLPAGFALHEYRLDKVLGQGGFGITYLATDIHLNTPVAIKEYLPRGIACRLADGHVSPRTAQEQALYQQGLDSFLVEARTLATFRHPNIVRVARFFEAQNTAYMVLEYEKGESLKSWWPRHMGLSEPDLLALLHPLLAGIATVHQAGYLHRDIKPDNIQVRRADNHLVLLDFGSARQHSKLSAKDPANAVTPGYAPLEQYDGRDQGPWTDIYALGATLYWMVTGQKPAAAPQRQAGQDAVLADQAASYTRYSLGFLQAIDWALQPDPLARPQSITQFCQALFSGYPQAQSLQEALQAEPRSGHWRGFLGTAPSWRSRLSALVHPRSWPMTLKMTLALVMAALLPMMITAYYNLDRTLAQTSTDVLQSMEQFAESSAARIAQVISDTQNLARYLTTDRELLTALQNPLPANLNAVQHKLNNLASTHPGLSPLFVMDRQGTALISNDPGVTGKNFRFRKYFQEAMAGRPYITGLMVGATAGQAGAYHAEPVRDASGTVIGAVVLRMRGSFIGTILDEVRHNGLTPLLIDGDGVLVYHPDPDQLYQSLIPLPEATLKAIAADQRFRRDYLNDLNMPEVAAAVIGAKNPGHLSYYSNLSKVQEIAGYAPVKGHNWVVLVSKTRASFEQPLQQLFLNVLYSVLGIGLLFCLLAILAARSIVKPVERLTQAANALKAGNYDQATVPVTANDEIGQLARTFNVMIDVLRQRERERHQQPLAPPQAPLPNDPLGLLDDI